MPNSRINNRPTWDEFFMGIVDAAAKRATCDRGKSGCVIAKNKRVIATGYVGSPPGFPHCDEVGHWLRDSVEEDGKVTSHCVRTIHAEQNAICMAAREGVSLDGGTAYITMTPCGVCAKLLISCGIREVVCRVRYQTSQEAESDFKRAGVKLRYLTDNDMKY